MNTICVITSSRADYGLLSPLIKRIQKDSTIELELLVTGTHLSDDFGMTKEEIIADNIPVTYEMPILTGGKNKDLPSYVMARVLEGMAVYLQTHKPDMAVILGDRYEIFAACIALINARVRIAHLCGGETTQGALDEYYRHGITKMAYLHFVTNAVHRKRVIQLGEDPQRVFDTGSTSIENIYQLTYMPLSDIQNALSFDLVGKPFAVVTFHPTTMEDNTAKDQCTELFAALDQFDKISYIITKSNADEGGNIINRLIDSYAAKRDNVLAVMSLGSQRYLSLLKYSTMVVGNSSSGIIEAPSFGIPTVNIGDRQKGRMQAGSIINALPERVSIIAAMQKAMDPQFRAKCRLVTNPYGNGHASERMYEVLKEYISKDTIDNKKVFYDIDFEVKS